MEPTTKQDLFNGLTLLFVFMMLLFAAMTIYFDRCHNKEMFLLEEINNKIDQREKRDSAHIAHIGECLWISRDNVSIDKRGFLKSNYLEDGLSQAK